MSQVRVAWAQLRRAKRYFLNPPLQSLTEALGPISVIDLSTSGARIEHRQPTRVGSLVRIRLRCVEERVQTSVTGRVVWTRLAFTAIDGREKDYVTGVEFQGPVVGVDAVVAALVESGRASEMEELRQVDRYILFRPLAATFTGYGEVEIENISESGIRIRAGEVMRPGRDGTFRFKVPSLGHTISGKASIVWSQAVSAAGSAGLIYTAGLRIGVDPLPSFMIDELCKSGVARLDLDSYRVKLELLRSRAISRQQQGIQVNLTDEQLTRIHEAWKELESDPVRAAKWYQRARFVAVDAVSEGLLRACRYRNDILAVWELLDRSMHLGAIVAFFRAVEERRDLFEERRSQSQERQSRIAERRVHNELPPQNGTTITKPQVMMNPAMRILVIDDDEEMRNIAAVSLEMNPEWEAATAASGPEGIKMAAEGHPDLILIDSVMPNMDGAATLRLLRAFDQTRSIPVIVLSGTTSSEELQRLRELGARGVITKPYNPQNLAAEVARIMSEAPR